MRHSTLHFARAGLGIQKLAGAAAFSLGLMRVVIAGAKSFTGNNLMVFSVMSREISLKTMFKHWAVVCGQFYRIAAAGYHRQYHRWCGFYGDELLGCFPGAFCGRRRENCLNDQSGDNRMGDRINIKTGHRK